MRAWTLGFPPAYERAIRIPGNSKAPGGYVFRKRLEATLHTKRHEDAARYRPYEIELPGTWEECTTIDYSVAARARHEWHSDERPFMPECGICIGVTAVHKLEYALLTVCAPLINPDTGQPA